MPEPPIDPRNPSDWQEAVDWAFFSLSLHSARCYGLIVGGPEVNVERCEELLSRGCELGYAPENRAVERCLAGLLAHEARA